MQLSRSRRLELIVAGALVLSTAFAYAGVAGNEFLHMDDNQYVSDNPFVQAGLSRRSIVWAWTTGHAANWHPLTWLSHCLDGQVFGMNPAGHHVTNLVLHIASVLLLFHFLCRATGSIGSSGFVAAVFALHPLHVESVAWIAERKDVLSGLFWMCTLVAYLRWVERPSAGRYAFVVVACACALLSKPMSVTLPFVLLLLDVWPLRRLTIRPLDHSTAWVRLKEKIPLLLLAACSCVVTLIVQREHGAMHLAAALPLIARIENALVSYSTYLLEAVWPSRLTFFHPHPVALYPLAQVAGAFALLGALTCVACLAVRSRPYLLVGWLWFLGTLVPVIGLVQVGDQARADRYTYLPLIGVSIAVAWGVSELARSFRRGLLAVSTLGVALALSWMLLAREQLRYWKNDRTLFGREAEIVPDSNFTHEMLGLISLRERRLDEAIAEYRIALRLGPWSAVAHSNYGMALELQGKKDEALSEYRDAVRLDPGLAEAHVNLGKILAGAGKVPEAVEQFEAALKSSPDVSDTHYNLGIALSLLGRIDEAIAHFERAVELSPGFVEAERHLAAARGGRGARPPR